MTVPQRSSPAVDRPASPLTLRDRATLATLRALMLVPFRRRSALAGWIGRIGGLFSSRRQRVATSVRHFLPHLTDVEVNRIAAQVPGNYLRMILEILSIDDMAALGRMLPLEGPGIEALDRAHAEGRAVILASGHFANYDAWRLALIARGFRIGSYFKELPNPALNRLYLSTFSSFGHAAFPDSAEGRMGMVRFLKSGGMLGMLFDLDRANGEMLDFLGQPTRTVLSLAELALRYDALLVPIFAIRTPGSPGFRIEIDTPVPHTDARTMTAALNEALADRVRRHPEQWVWWHRRRKSTHP